MEIGSNIEIGQIPFIKRFRFFFRKPPAVSGINHSRVNRFGQVGDLDDPSAGGFNDNFIIILNAVVAAVSGWIKARGCECNLYSNIRPGLL